MIPAGSYPRTSSSTQTARLQVVAGSRCPTCPWKPPRITLNCVPAVSVVLPDPQISICESCWEEPVTTTPPSWPGRGSRAKKRPRQEEKSGHWPQYTPWGILGVDKRLLSQDAPRRGTEGEKDHDGDKKEKSVPLARQQLRYSRRD